MGLHQLKVKNMKVMTRKLRYKEQKCNKVTRIMKTRV